MDSSRFSQVICATPHLMLYHRGWRLSVFAAMRGYGLESLPNAVLSHPSSNPIDTGQCKGRKGFTWCIGAFETRLACQTQSPPSLVLSGNGNGCERKGVGCHVGQQPPLHGPGPCPGDLYRHNLAAQIVIDYVSSNGVGCCFVGAKAPRRNSGRQSLPWFDRQGGCHADGEDSEREATGTLAEIVTGKGRDASERIAYVYTSCSRGRQGTAEVSAPRVLSMRGLFRAWSAFSLLLFDLHND